MNQKTVQENIASFYDLLTAASKDPKLGSSIIGPSLLAFFNNAKIKDRWLTAPASTAVRFHHAFEGGLVVHTLEVFCFAQIVANALGEMITHPMLKLSGWNFDGKDPIGFVPYVDLMAATFLHDLSKIGDTFGVPRFAPNMIKGGTVRSDKIPYESSEKLGKFDPRIDLTQTGPTVQAMYLAEQAMEWVPDGVQSLSIVRAIDPVLFGLLSDDIKFAVIHHDGAYGKGRRLLGGHETPLQMLLHFADMWSSRVHKEGFHA